MALKIWKILKIWKSRYHTIFQIFEKTGKMLKKGGENFENRWENFESTKVSQIEHLRTLKLKL